MGRAALRGLQALNNTLHWVGGVAHLYNVGLNIDRKGVQARKQNNQSSEESFEQSHDDDDVFVVVSKGR